MVRHAFVTLLTSIDIPRHKLLDVLSQFNAVQSKQATTTTRDIPPASPLTSPAPPPPTASTSSTFGRPRTNTRVDQPPKSNPGKGVSLDATDEIDEDALTADFAAELSKGMESLMKELTAETGGNENEGDDDASKKALRAWEEMLIKEMNDMTDGDVQSKAEESEQRYTEERDFQSKIQDTVKRLREHETNLKVGAPFVFDCFRELLDSPKPQSSSSETQRPGNMADPDSFESLLASLQELGLDGEADDDMAGMLENMMGQLMSKEILYEPLKELAEKVRNPKVSLNNAGIFG